MTEGSILAGLRMIKLMKYVSNVYGALYANFYLIYIVCNFLSDKIDQLLPPVMFFGQLTITQLQQ